MDETDVLDRPDIDDDESTNAADAPTGPPEPIGSAIITALEACWRAIQARHPEVPDVVMIMGTGINGRQRPKYGHFAATCWHGREPKTADEEKPSPLPEVLVGGEGLARDPWEVFATLLHEAAHAKASALEIKDTSRQGKYHNAKFKELAEGLGIEVEKDRTIGWSITTIPERTIRIYEDVIDALGLALVRYRDTRVASASRKKVPPLICNCGEDRKIRASKKVLAMGPIMCSTCGAEFKPQEDDDEDGEG